MCRIFHVFNPLNPPYQGDFKRQWVNPIVLTYSPLQAGFQTPPAVRNTQVIIEKCVSPVLFIAKDVMVARD